MGVRKIKTEALKKAVVSLIGNIGGKTYYRQAPDNAQFPYKTFGFSSINLGDVNLDMVVMTVSLWDKSKAYATLEEIADNIENLLNVCNYPQETILPTFYKIDRQYINDPDDTIKRIDLKFNIMNYERA